MAQVVYTFDVDDTSPAIKYSPFGDTLSTPDLLRGWNPYFTESGFARFPSERGVGNSMHISALNGSSVSLQWRGTGIELLGNATQATFAITLDGEPQTATPDSDTLAKFSSLTDSNHTITLTALTTDSDTSDSFIAFDKFVITSIIPTNDTTSTSITNDTLPEHSVAFSGAWSFINDTVAGIGLSAHRSTRIGDRIVTHFLGTAFSLLGTTSPSAGTFSVSVDGTVTTVDARSSFNQPDALLYFVSGLDLNATHTVQITNGDGELIVLTDGFVVYSNGTIIPPETTPTPSPSPNPQSSTTFPKGSIAALVLGGILGFILIILLLLYLLVVRPRRRRRQQTSFPPPMSSSKELEAAEEVLDIGPNGPRGEQSAGLAGFVDRRDSHAIERRWERENRERRASGRSNKTGFARWKDEVEYGFGGRGLGALGLVFRRSLGAGTVRSTENDHGHTTEDEKNPQSPDQDKGEASLPSSPIAPSSSSGDNVGISVVSRMMSSRKIKGKKKKSAAAIRQTGDSPSFTIDLPLPDLPTLSRNSASPRNTSPQISGSRSSGSMPQFNTHPITAPQRSSIHSSSISGQSGGANGSNRAQHERTPNQSDSSPALSYISSPVYPHNDQPTIPASTPAAVSQPAPPPVTAITPIPVPTTSSDRVAASSSRPVSAQPRPLPLIRPTSQVPQPSTSRPESRDQPRPISVRPLPVPKVSTPTHQHNRSSSGLLLQSGEPNADSPDDDAYQPTVYRATASIPYSAKIVEESSRAMLLPPQGTSKGDRGSVSSGYVTDMDGLVKAETTTGQIAIRGLRPRISEAKVSEGRSTPSLTIETAPLPHPRRREGAGKEKEQARPALPEVEETSPFRVDFPGALGSGSRDEHGHVKFGSDQRPRSTPISLNDPSLAASGSTKPKKVRALPRIPSLRQKASFRLTPPPGVPPLASPQRSDSDGVMSFLDFGGGSTEGSIRTQSNDSSSHRKSARSRWSGPSMITSLYRRPSTNLPHQEEAIPSGSDGSNHDRIPPTESQPRPQSHSQSESSGKASNSSGGFPFPVSLPPSPHHPPGSYSSMQQLATPQRSNLPAIPTVNVINSSPHGSTYRQEPVRPHHPSGLPGPEAISPSDSIPISVSDLHFRHSDSESTTDSLSRRASEGSHLPPHPPLPGSSLSSSPSPSPADLAFQRLLGIIPPHSDSPQGHRSQGSAPRK